MAVRTHLPAMLLCGVAVSLVVAGCGGNSASTAPPSSTSPSVPGATATSPAGAAVTAADVSGKSYTSTSVHGHTTVSGTQIHLGFTHDAMAVEAGCNTMTGPFEIAGETLRWTSPPAATMKACSQELSQQDAWLTTAFTQGLHVEGDATTLHLSNSQVTINLAVTATTPSAELQQLLGKKWPVSAYIDKGRATRIPSEDPVPYVETAKDGTASLFTGCNHGQAKVTISGEKVVFSDITTQSKPCATSAQRHTEEIFLRVLHADGGAPAIHENGSLVLSRGPQSLIFDVG